MTNTNSSITAVITHAGKFTSYDYGTFKIHVYNSNDVMADTSFVVEGQKELVELEVPLFKENAAEFEAYVKKLGKPVVATITDYHEGSVCGSKLYVAEGMRKFLVGPIYGGMMGSFQKQWAGKIVSMPDVGKATEVKFGETVKIAGVDFKFEKGASSDFPAATILIGGKACLTHWVPAKSHPSFLQISSAAAVDAEIEAAKKSIASGAELFLGGHGGAAAKDAVEYKISYLETLKKLTAESKDAETLAGKIGEAFPDLPGAANIDALAKAIKK